MKKVNDERYQLIGEIAIALYSKSIKISFDSLKAIMKDHGFEYSEDVNRGLAQSVRKAYLVWKSVDPAINHAIAYTFTNQHGQPAWE